VQPRLSTVWHTGLSGGAPDSVRCARLVSGELWETLAAYDLECSKNASELQSAIADFGKLWRRTTIIHRTVRWCTGLSGEPTVASATVGRAIRGQRVARSNGRQGAPDCPVHQLPQICNSRMRQKRKEIAHRTATRLSGGAPDCPVRGKICLPRMPPTAPGCLGAIKGTLRRMEENQKHSLSILSLPHSVSAHLIDFVSDLSPVLVVNSLCFIRAQVLACVCA
jgi:hypothetical protein